MSAPDWYAEPVVNRIQQILVQNLDRAERFLLADVAAMSDGQLNASRGGAARKAYDLLYEIAGVNRWMAARLRGEDPGPRPFAEGAFPTAPPELCHKNRILSLLKESFKDLRVAFENLPPDSLLEPMPNSERPVTPLETIIVAASHTFYHDGQLNYMQALDGDSAIHWETA
jgi:uncharacterized damage-inducible protein DinB